MKSGGTGLASARQNLTPLYSAGLWLAVNCTPGRFNWPDANHNWSVALSPMSTTEAPARRAPSAKAHESSRPSARMSRPRTNSSAPVSSTNAAPSARAPSTSHWGVSPTTIPRMSLALKISWSSTSPE